ncbi:MAG TPA: hypothetical protein EYP33_03385 [Pyrodictium sp.]|nr:hypothetical protein [Pyrodictium sp.]
MPRRDVVYKAAKRKKLVAPKYVRKFAAHNITRLLGIEIASHIAGHDRGSTLFPRMRSVAKTWATRKRYVGIEDIAAERYHGYAEWLEENVASRELLEWQ